LDRSDRLAGQIIVVSGTSGAGKSTTCDLFTKRSSDFWLQYGIDHFLGGSFPSAFGHHGPRSREGVFAHPVDDSDPEGPLRWSFGERGKQAFGVMHEWVAAASREGCNIILDQLMMLDPPVLQDCIWRLKDLPVLFVSLKPSYEVLMQRVATRKMGGKSPTGTLDEAATKRVVERLSRLRPWFYDAIYANDLYDLEVDSTAHTPEQVCALIEQRLAAGPGTAFEQLRARYPRP
jgi:chloramphenicol 3-O-phosphotransferase